MNAIASNLRHLTWGTKYRRPVISSTALREVVGACILASACRHGVTIVELNVQPEHVHALVEIPEGMTESRVLQLLKGGSSFAFLKEHPQLRSNGSLWADDANRRPVGEGEIPAVVDYIRKQDEHHHTVWN